VAPEEGLSSVNKEVSKHKKYIQTQYELILINDAIQELTPIFLYA
jgi:hypothetical protein